MPNTINGADLNRVFNGIKNGMLAICQAGGVPVPSNTAIDELATYLTALSFGDGITMADITAALSTHNLPGSGAHTNKADRIIGATAGNIAALDESGNIADSGVAASEIGELSQDVAQLQEQINNQTSRYETSFQSAFSTATPSGAAIDAWFVSSGTTASAPVAGTVLRNVDNGHLWVKYTSTGWSDVGVADGN